MKEYSGYQMEDVFQMLAKDGVVWDGKLTDFIQGDNNELDYTEVDATVAALKNGYINEHIADVRFDWIEVTADSFNYKYKGRVRDLSEDWVNYLLHRYPDYEDYSRQYYEICQANLNMKLASQQDKSSTLSTIIMEQLDVLKGKRALLEVLSKEDRLER